MNHAVSIMGKPNTSQKLYQFQKLTKERHQCNPDTLHVFEQSPVNDILKASTHHPTLIRKY